MTEEQKEKIVGAFIICAVLALFLGPGFIDIYRESLQNHSSVLAAAKKATWGVTIYAVFIASFAAIFMAFVFSAGWLFQRVPFLGYAVGGCFLVLWIFASVTGQLGGGYGGDCEYGLSGLDC